MALERTLSIVKPDGVARNLIGEVLRRFEKAGLKVIAARMVHLSQRDAEGFYAVHAARPFFKDLVKYMTSGPVLVQVLEGEGAIAKNREVMGATDPKKAAPGTIRADLAESIEANTVHGSDAPETAAKEIAYFFRETELCPRRLSSRPTRTAAYDMPTHPTNQLVRPAEGRARVVRRRDGQQAVPRAPAHALAVQARRERHRGDDRSRQGLPRRARATARK